MGVLFFLQILAAVAIAYLPFAGWMSIPWTGDQKVYLSTAIEMEHQRSLMIPYLFGEPSYYKPPLQYWSTIAGLRSLGYSLWGAFIPSVIATLMAALALWSIASRVLPKTEESHSPAASRAALWFVGSLGTATFGAAAQMEIYLVALGLSAWAFALAYLDRTPRDRLKNPWALYAAFLTVGLLAWVKSPLYSVLWVLGYLMLLVLRKDWREFRSLHSYVAGVFGALVGASWYLVVLGLDYDRFVSDYFIRETLSKQGGNAGTPGELWIAVLGFAVPFVLLSLGALSSLAAQSARKLLSFAVVAAVPPAVFFSVYPYRVSTYLYVLVPILAVMAAFFEKERPRSAAMVSRLGAGIMTLGTAYLVWLGIRIGMTSGMMMFLIAAVGAISAAAWILSMVQPRFGVWAAIVFVGWLHFLGVALGERDIAGMRDFVSLNEHRHLAMLDPDKNIWHEVGLLSVALKRPIDRLSTPEEVLDALDSGNAVIVSEEQASTIVPALRQLLDDQEDGRDIAVTGWSRFPTRKSLPLRELLRAKAVLELSRKFQILTLPPPGDWIMPEGGV